MAFVDFDTLLQLLPEEVTVSMPMMEEKGRPGNTPVVRHLTKANSFGGAMTDHNGSGRPDLTVKLILLGDFSVGKSSLLRILARQNHFRDSISVSDNNDNTVHRSSSMSSLGFGSLSRSESPSSPRALVCSALKPGGFVDVWFTHQGKTVLARIADTGGE